MTKTYTHAIFRFNNARGAILCNRCQTIVATGNGPHEDVEHYCDGCRKVAATKNPDLSDKA